MILHLERDRVVQITCVNPGVLSGSFDESMSIKISIRRVGVGAVFIRGECVGLRRQRRNARHE